MVKCAACNKRNVSKHNQPNFRDLCFTCSSLELVVSSIEMYYAEKAPKGTKLALQWQWVEV